MQADLIRKAFWLRHRVGNRLQGLAAKRLQSLLIRQHPRTLEGLILFLVPGSNTIGGGVISIVNLCSESRKLCHAKDYRVLLSTPPENASLLKYTMFRNEEFIFPFRQVLRYFCRLHRIIIHVPDIFVETFPASLNAEDRELLAKIPDVHINILHQNSWLMNGKRIESLKELGRVTCTMFQDRILNKQLRMELGVPIHWIGPSCDPSQFCYQQYREKQDILVVGRDKHPRKQSILAGIQTGCPQLKIVVVEWMYYEQYKRLISESKWSLSFGEGFDGYFLQTVCSGGIGFTVYNDEFFPMQLHGLRTVYADYAQLEARILGDLRELDDYESYSAYAELLYDAAVRRYCSYPRYLANVREFYDGQYTLV